VDCLLTDTESSLYQIFECLIAEKFYLNCSSSSSSSSTTTFTTSYSYSSSYIDPCEVQYNNCVSDPTCSACYDLADIEVINSALDEAYYADELFSLSCPDLLSIFQLGFPPTCDVTLENSELSLLVECTINNSVQEVCSDDVPVTTSPQMTPAFPMEVESCVDYIFPCLNDPGCIACAMSLDEKALTEAVEGVLMYGLGPNFTCGDILTVVKQGFTSICVPYESMFDSVMDCILKSVFGLDNCSS